MEKSYEDDLRGVDGSKDIEVDAFGRKVKKNRFTFRCFSGPSGSRAP